MCSWCVLYYKTESRNEAKANKLPFINNRLMELGKLLAVSD